MKQYLYHVSDEQNTKSILMDGLKRKNGFCIYLSEDPFSWWKPGMDIFRVRITGLKGLKTTIPELDEILCFEDISALRVSRFLPGRMRLRRATEEYERTHGGADNG